MNVSWGSRGSPPKTVAICDLNAKSYAFCYWNGIYGYPWLPLKFQFTHHCTSQSTRSLLIQWENLTCGFGVLGSMCGAMPKVHGTRCRSSCLILGGQDPRCLMMCDGRDQIPISSQSIIIYLDWLVYYNHNLYQNLGWIRILLWWINPIFDGSCLILALQNRPWPKKRQVDPPLSLPDFPTLESSGEKEAKRSPRHGPPLSISGMAMSRGRRHGLFRLAVPRPKKSSTILPKKHAYTTWLYIPSGYLTQPWKITIFYR